MLFTKAKMKTITLNSNIHKQVGSNPYLLLFILIMIQIFKTKVVIPDDIIEDNPYLYVKSIADVNAYVDAIMADYLLLYPKLEKKDIDISINYVNLKRKVIEKVIQPKQRLSDNRFLPIVYEPIQS